MVVVVPFSRENRAFSSNAPTAGWPGKGPPAANSRRRAGFAQGSVICQASRKIFPDRKCEVPISSKTFGHPERLVFAMAHLRKDKGWYHPQFDRT
jgi:hypothetical protein